MKTLLWHHLPCNDDQAATLAAALGVHPIIARLLCLRGFSNVDDATRFLNPSLDHLHDPFRLADMDRAVDRLEQALARRERIAIHGDYDVDGITSTVILRRALEMLGDGDEERQTWDRLLTDQAGSAYAPHARRRLAALR